MLMLKKKKEGMWRRQQQLPDELMVEILCRLPPKSLMRFRCVCKSWYSLITNSSFISLHRRHSRSFLLLEGHNFDTLSYQYSVLRSCSDLSSLSNPLSLPQSYFPQCSILLVLAVCNGLLCVSYYCDGTADSPVDDCSRLLICNPSIRRFLSLPQPFPYSRNHLVVVAFGFDSRNSDYKIVRLASRCCKTNRTLSPEVEVYSLASGCWKTLPPGVAPASYLSLGGQYKTHAFVNGLAHWTMKRWVEDNEDDAAYYFVLSFDFVDEVFREIALPQSVVQSCTYGSVFLVGDFTSENALTVLHVQDPKYCGPPTGTIWMMKEYGVVESWIKLFYFEMIDDYWLEAPSLGICIPVDVRLPRAFCITNNGQILLTRGDYHLYFLDVEEKRIVDLQLQGNSCWQSFNLCYAETLVLLDSVCSLKSY